MDPPAAHRLLIGPPFLFLYRAQRNATRACRSWRCVSRAVRSGQIQLSRTTQRDTSVPNLKARAACCALRPDSVIAHNATLHERAELEGACRVLCAPARF